MAARFIDLYGKIGSERTKESQKQLQDLRQSFYETVEASWAPCRAERPIPAELLKEVSEKSRKLAAGARGLVDELYPWCGLAAADRDTEINRVWRNLHTASQHSLLTFGA